MIPLPGVLPASGLGVVVDIVAKIAGVIKDNNKTFKHMLFLLDNNVIYILNSRGFWVPKNPCSLDKLVLFARTKCGNRKIDISIETYKLYFVNIIPGYSSIFTV